MKKLAIYSLFPLLLFGTLSLSGCGTDNNEEAYDELYETITTFKGTASYKRVDELLDVLPEDYKDVKPIKEEYISMRRYIVQLSDAFKDDVSQSLGDSSRKSLVELYKIQDKNVYWNISKFLTNKNVFKSAVFGQKWENDGYSLHWYEGDGNYKYYLATNLPNPKESDKDYKFFTRLEDDGLAFYYENAKDTQDIVKSYIVKHMGYEADKLYINVSCTSNSKIYKLLAE